MVDFLKGGTSIEGGTPIMQEIGSPDSLKQAVEGLEAEIKRFVDSGPNLVVQTERTQAYTDWETFRPDFIPFDPTGYKGYNWIANYRIDATRAFADYMTGGGRMPVLLSEGCIQWKTNEVPDYRGGVLGAGHYTAAG